MEHPVVLFLLRYYRQLSCSGIVRVGLGAEAFVVSGIGVLSLSSTLFLFVRLRIDEIL